MSLKNAEAGSIRSPRVWSITQRLTLLYAASTAALLVLAGSILYWTLQHSLVHTRYGLLASKVEILRTLLREHADKAEVLVNEVEHEASESQPLKYFIRVLNADGRTWLETPGMGERVSPDAFPPALEITADLHSSIEGMMRHQGVFLLLAARAQVGHAGPEQRVIQIAIDTSTGNALLAEYRRTLFAVVGLGLVFAAVVGAWVARKGMQPLAAVSETARHTTASQLHDRIVVSQWPAELAELAAAFNAMLGRLEDSFTRLSQFSADLAHALRTPIHNLRGEAEVALARGRTVEEYQQVLTSSLEECDRLAAMIDGLLFLARADDCRIAMQRARLDVRHQMEAVSEFYEALASEQSVSVICEGHAWLVGDPMLFRRAISNLLGNALRHTPAGGTVHLTARAGGDGSVEVTVRDTGCGIAPGDLPRVFDRFFQATQSATTRHGGAGLGLTIVQSITRLHGGSVRVQSTVGQGTTFTLIFPASPPASNAASAQVAASG